MNAWSEGMSTAADNICNNIKKETKKYQTWVFLVMPFREVSMEQ